MRRAVLLLAFALFALLAACREERPPTPPTPVPANAGGAGVNTLAGCELGDLENWYEAVALNAKSFRDETFGLMTLPPESAYVALNRLSDLRDPILAAQAPECVAGTQSIVRDSIDLLFASFALYEQGSITQETLIAQVTQGQQIYDQTALPALDAARALLEEQLQAN
jgi:hypothetical protein